MAVPEALLNAIGGSAPTSKNPLEKLGEAPFSGSDGPSFSAAMRDASTSARSQEETVASDEASESGKALPELPERSPARARLRVVPASDQNLEEFAVGMGIDRELARLLLSETAPATSGTAEAEAIVPDHPTTEDTTDAAVNPAIPTVMAPSLVAMMARPDTTAVTTLDTESVDVAVNAAADTTIEMVPTPPTSANPAPIADEDLLLWRSKLSSSTAMIEANDSSATPATMAAEDTTAIASTVGQLRARSAAMSISIPAAAEMAPTGDSQIGEAREAVSSLESDRFSRRNALSEKSAASSDPLPMLRDVMSLAGAAASNGGEGSLGDRSHKNMNHPASFADLPVSMTAISLPESSDLSFASLSGSSGIDSSLGLSSASITISEASRVLSTPDPKMSFGERVQAFADAVAQRVLGQIRDENWSVSLQLEPANMGAMDIDLTMRGNAVAANVGVSNADVRALLESGLPRLRESLESAGLQLAGWTFGQSGSRAFSEPARKMFSQTSLRARANGVDSVAEVGASRVMTGKELGSSAVDLFV